MGLKSAKFLFNKPSSQRWDTSKIKSNEKKSNICSFWNKKILMHRPQKKIFIGGGMLPDTYEILSHIAIGMDENPQIISDQSNLLICTIKPTNLKSLFFNLNQLGFFYQIPIYYYVALRSLIKSKENRNFFENQLYSSYYGSALIKNPEGRISLSYKAKLIGLIAVIMATTKFAILKNANVNIFIMAHMVYGARTIIAWAREYDLKVFASANNTIFRLRQDENDYVNIRSQYAYSE